MAANSPPATLRREPVSVRRLSHGADGPLWRDQLDRSGVTRAEANQQLAETPTQRIENKNISDPRMGAPRHELRRGWLKMAWLSYGPLNTIRPQSIWRCAWSAFSREPRVKPQSGRPLLLMTTEPGEPWRDLFVAPAGILRDPAPQAAFSCPRRQYPRGSGRSRSRRTGWRARDGRPCWESP